MTRDESSSRPPSAHRNVRGRLTSRLLVNTIADPDEVARHLPPDVRPHVTSDGGTIVGCCLLDLAAVRPGPVTAAVGMRVRAVAHRISVEWRDALGQTEVGVYVPIRHTTSRAAVLAGGRWFPGVHDPAVIDLDDHDGGLDWDVTPTDPTSPFALTVSAEPTDTVAVEASDRVGAICVGANIGLSPDRRGRLEAARMEPSHRRAQVVRITTLRSAFLEQFTSAVPAPSFLMSDVDVIWTRAWAPGPASRAAAA